MAKESCVIKKEKNGDIHGGRSEEKPLQA